MDYSFANLFVYAKEQTLLPVPVSHHALLLSLFLQNQMVLPGSRANCQSLSPIIISFSSPFL